MTLAHAVLTAGFALSLPVLYRAIGARWLVPVAALLAAAVLPVGLLGSTVLTLVAFAAAWHVHRRRPAPTIAPTPTAAHTSAGASPPPRPPRTRRDPRDPPPAYTLAIGPLRQSIDIPLGVEEGHHALCVGATGWGKTWAMLTVIRAHIRAGFGCVVIDMKGSADLIERLRLEAVLADLPFWHFSLGGGNRWNPLARGDRSELKDKLISSQHFSEEHYKRLYERHLLNVLGFLERRGGGPIDFARLIPLLDPERLRGELRTLDDPDAAEELSTYLTMMSSDERHALRGLTNRLAVIAEGVQGEYLSAAGDPAELIDLARAVASRGVVVFSLETSRYPETAALMGNLALQDLNAVSGLLESRPASTPPMLIAVDEFSGLAGTHVLNLFQRARSPRWSLLLLTQEVADLRRVRPTFHEEVSANVELVIGGRQSNPESAEWLSRIAGSREVWRRSFALDHRGRPTGRGTMEAVHEPIVPPDTIMRLTKGDALVIRKRPHHDAGVGTVIPAGSILDRWPEGTSREWILARAAHLRWLAWRSHEDRGEPGGLPGAFSASQQIGAAQPPPL